MFEAKFSIDTMDDPGWYHLGNMYWCSEYQPFWKWFNIFKYNVDYILKDDFPHSYFQILSDKMKEEFNREWMKYVITPTVNAT